MVSQLSGSVVIQEISSAISDELSTTVPLLASQVYTSSSVRNNFLQVSVSCHTDVNGTLYFDFSNDNVNWTSFPVAGFNIKGGIHAYHTARKDNRYFRVRMVNGSSDQNYLRLYVYFGGPGLPNAPLNQSFFVDVDAILTRNPYDPVEVSLGRSNSVSADDSPKFGYNPDLGTTEETIWSNSSRWVRGTSNDTVTITSSSGNDTSGGSGAQSVRIEGINAATGERDVEVVTMSGTGSVVSTKTWKLGGMNRVSVVSAGVTGTNEGNITVTHTTDGSIQAYVPVGLGVTQQLIYTVSDNEYILLDGIKFNAAKLSGGGQPRIEIRGYRYLENSVSQRFFTLIMDTAVTNEIEYGFGRIPIKVRGISQFELTAISNTASSFISSVAHYSNIAI